MKTEGMQTTQATTATATEKEARAKLIARMSNDHLLKLREAVSGLYTNLDSSYWYSYASGKVKAERDGLLNEVKMFRGELEEEYAARLLRGYHSQFQKLTAELQPQATAVMGRLIPINAATAEQQKEGEQQEALQTMNTLVEQFRAALASFNPTNEDGSAAQSNAANEEEEGRQ